MTSQPASDTQGAVSPLRGFDFAQAWLAGDSFVREALPATEDLMKRRLEGLADQGWAAWSMEEIAELEEFNTAAGNAAGAELAKKLAAPDALVVVTGQQPDLLASPLFVLYKALAAVAWAQRLSMELRRDVTPVFWVASDDDDFAELKHAWLASWKGELVDAGGRISRGEGVRTGAPAYDWNLGESAERIDADVRRALSGWPGGERTAEWLAEQVASESNFERSFCRLLTALLGEEFPILLVAPRLLSFRRRGAKVLAKDVQLHSQVNSAVTGAANAFLERGYPVMLARDEEALNFFWLQDGRRQRLVRSEDGNIAALDPVTFKEKVRFSEGELLQRLKESPEDFAPNVVTRPVVQDTVLPTLLYVAGPGELAYLALLGEAYAGHGVARSAVAPRGMVVMELPGDEDNAAGADSAHGALEKESDFSREMLSMLGDLSAEMEKRLDAIRAASDGRRSDIERSLQKTETHMRRGIGQLTRRLARQAAPEHWNLSARRTAISAPGGKPQERILAPWNFVKAGEWDSLARWVAQHADLRQTGPHVIPMAPWISEAL